MKVGILGATGAVGRQMLASIEERNIEVDEIRLFASLKSAGKKFAYKDTYIELEVYIVLNANILRIIPYFDGI